MPYQPCRCQPDQPPVSWEWGWAQHFSAVAGVARAPNECRRRLYCLRGVQTIRRKIRILAKRVKLSLKRGKSHHTDVSRRMSNTNCGKPSWRVNGPAIRFTFWREGKLFGALVCQKAGNRKCPNRH